MKAWCLEPRRPLVQVAVTTRYSIFTGSYRERH